MGKNLHAPQVYRPLARPGPRVVILSVSISILLIAPLWLGLETLAGGSSTSQPTGRMRSVPFPPYQPNPAPLPGEILVRFEPPVADTLHLALLAATSPDGLTHLPESLLIGARLTAAQTSLAAPAFESLFSQFALSAADAIDPELGMWRLKINPQVDPRQAVATFAEHSGVCYAEANYPIYAFNQEPNDPYFSRNQPALRQIKAPEAWDITTGSSNVTIAVLDTGLAYGHIELRDKIIAQRGRNFVAEPANEFAWDDNSHGTFVAGIAAASSNNNAGMAGVAWGAKLISIKVLDEGEQGSIATLSMGMDYASTQPVNIVNMSTGGPVRSQIMEEVARKAYNRGLILVAASGNNGASGKPEYNYPAALDTVIAVGASNELDQVANFSSFGPYVALVAPGTNIFSLSWAGGQDYAISNGTSFSCPFVVGAIALMLSVNPALNATQVRNILEATADPVATASPPPGSTLSGTFTPSATLTVPPTSFPSLATITPAAALSANALGSNYSALGGWGRLNIYQAVQAARDNKTMPSRENSITGTITGLPDPQEATIKLEPGDERFAAKDGSYQFANLPAGNYKLTVLSRKYNLRTTTNFNFQGQTAESASFNFNFRAELEAVLKNSEPAGAFLPVAQAPDPGSRFFAYTGHSLGGPFKTFWDSRGGVAVFGYPISEEFQENGMTVQYFERAVLEYHAEYALTRSQVQSRLLGNLLTLNRLYEPAFKPLAVAPTNNPDYFPSTGHVLAEPFRSYWQANGGLDLFGYPISEVIPTTDAKGKLHYSQYFERCRMDYFPEIKDPTYTVQLGLLGRETAQLQHLLGTSK